MNKHRFVDKLAEGEIGNNTKVGFYKQLLPTQKTITYTN
jgi:hypothetical protein